MQEKEQTRVTATLPPDMIMKLNYWAAKHNMTINQYLAFAIRQYVKWEKADHSVPTQEIRRLNTCVMAVEELGQSVLGLQDTMISGFDALMGATRGDSVFLEPESGDIDRIMITEKDLERQMYKKRRRKRS